MKYLGVFDNPGQLVQDWISEIFHLPVGKTEK